MPTGIEEIDIELGDDDGFSNGAAGKVLGYESGNGRVLEIATQGMIMSPAVLEYPRIMATEGFIWS